MSRKPHLPPKPDVPSKPSMLPKPKATIKPVPVAKATKPSLPPKPKSGLLSRSLPIDITINKTPVKIKPNLPPKVQVYRKAMMMPKPYTQNEKSNLSYIFKTISNSSVPSSKYRSLPYARDVVKHNIVRSHSMGKICHVTAVHEAIPVCDTVLEEEVTPICDIGPKEEVAWIRQRASTEEVTIVCDIVPIEEVITICDLAPMQSRSLTWETTLALEAILKCHVPQIREISSAQITLLQELVPTINMKISQTEEVIQSLMIPREKILSIQGINPKPSTMMEPALTQTKQITELELIARMEKISTQVAPEKEEILLPQNINSNKEIVTQNVEKVVEETEKNTPLIEMIPTQEISEMEKLQESILEQELLVVQVEEITQIKEKIYQKNTQIQNLTQEQKTESKNEMLEKTEKITQIPDKLAQEIIGMQEMLCEHKRLPQKEEHILHTIEKPLQPDAISLTLIQKMIEKHDKELPEEISKVQNDLEVQNKTLIQELLQTIEVEVTNNRLGTLLHGTIVEEEEEEEEEEDASVTRTAMNAVSDQVLGLKEEIFPDTAQEPIQRIRSKQKMILKNEMLQIAGTKQSQAVVSLPQKVKTIKELETAEDKTLDMVVVEKVVSTLEDKPISGQESFANELTAEEIIPTQEVIHEIHGQKVTPEYIVEAVEQIIEQVVQTVEKL